MNLANASFEGAKIVMFVAEPRTPARPGTPTTAAERLDKDGVDPRRSMRDDDEVEFDDVEFCAEAIAARAAMVKKWEYIL